MVKPKVQQVYLKDYSPPPFLVDSIELEFDLKPNKTRIIATSKIKRNNAAQNSERRLILDGEKLELVEIKINEKPLSHSDLSFGESTLTIENVPNEFTLKVTTEIDPKSNKALEGLYISGGRFCTQCEAEGFRRITYYPDRPDVLSRFKVTLVADAEDYPVLLSNGNCVSRGALAGNKHFTVWEDPFPKPCYLFALVAGDLGSISDTYKTASHMEVALNIYVEHGKERKAAYAMESLKRAMAWDEQTYGFEYDLSEFNIVAVSDFNMGAMENKSLNIFNDKFILADPETATDTDYAWIESVVAHEYFHNWTGNRITCRDWFQLSLKEGLTVFRDQQFSAGERSASVQRIEDVKRLRATQFVEDSGPLAHPVRPNSYAEINNFYTHTVYEKGAEVVRMIHTLVGAATFRKGMDLYVERHDGEAVTCEDFILAMEGASGLDLEQFLLWYNQAGTPLVSANGYFDEEGRRYTLTLKQTCPPTPGQTTKKPMHIPVSIGFVSSESGSIKTSMSGTTQNARDTHIISLHSTESQLLFEGFDEISGSIALSINRGFTAPIQTELAQSPIDLATLMGADPDPVSRWDASQSLACEILLRHCNNEAFTDILATYRKAIGSIIDNAIADPAGTALLITVPSEKIIWERMKPIDPTAVHSAREWLKAEIGSAFYDSLRALYEECLASGPFNPCAKDAGLRSLRNTALGYIASCGKAEGHELAYTHYKNADNMTDRWAGLAILNETDSDLRRTALNDFENRFEGNELVLDKWFTLEAYHPYPQTISRVEQLLSHSKYDNQNPNRIRALVGAFATGNAITFHDPSGLGYELLTNQIIKIDRFNPQTAARLMGAYQNWSKFEGGRKALMQEHLTRISAVNSLSPDISEIVQKCLEPNNA
ncbi:MAG: aminopeptidase N [Rhodospirillaceae bacterium]|nr:aminopeptidase N [Rhodospirillaceae bacterium]